jgi:hypothetical protein
MLPPPFFMKRGDEPAKSELKMRYSGKIIFALNDRDRDDVIFITAIISQTVYDYRDGEKE